MGRPEGRTNADFDAKRDALALRVLGALSEGEAGASMRELAAACEVTPPTLRHYFGDRDGAVRAALAMARRLGSEHLLRIATADLGPARPALAAALDDLLRGWIDHGVGRLHELGLQVGLGHASLGPAYLEEILEPTLQAFEARVALHVARGELAVADIRHATLALIGPLVLALLHQRELGGQRCRALDLRKLAAAQLADFLQLHAAAAPTRRRR
jgi:AcrR family transcriptional regulator